MEYLSVGREMSYLTRKRAEVTLREVLKYVVDGEE